MSLMILWSFLPLRLIFRFFVAAVEGIDGEVGICTKTNAVITASPLSPFTYGLDIYLKTSAVTTMLDE